jgi:ribonuclease HII
MIDGTIRLLDDPRVLTMPKADDLVKSVSAASIVAKVARDTYMTQLDQVFPDYGFAGHVGYGTALHAQKLREFGVLPGVHRASFAPIAKLLKPNQTKPGSRKNEFYTDGSGEIHKIDATAGRIAENVAAEFLENHGHQIIARNWRTKFCEIDLISIFDQTIFFTEVKYRENDAFGDGLAAITPAKLRQMRKSAEIFLERHANLGKGLAAQLSAISLKNEPLTIDQYLPNID